MEASIGEAPQPPKFDIWVVSAIILNRVVANCTAAQLNAIPLSEARLRDEGVIPYYKFLRKIVGTLKSAAREHGVTVPVFPEAPADWSEDVSTDYKALAAQFRPHLTEPMRAAMDWYFELRDKDPKPHWASEPAANCVSLELLIQMTQAMGGVMEGSEWEPFKDQITSNEVKWITKAMSEELLRIRAQSGSGWDEEEAKGMAMGQLERVSKFMELGA